MQSFQQWQRSPIQGAVPQAGVNLPHPDSYQIDQLASDLDRALRALKWAKRMALGASLPESHSAAYTAICDALTSTAEAIQRLNDAPDQ